MKANNTNYVTVNGFANNRTHERPQHDYYATEPKAVKLLLELEDFTDLTIWECACGEGHLSKEMETKGLVVHSTDLINRGFGTQYDFLCSENIEWAGHIITNPPYKLAQQFIEKSLEIVKDGCKVAMFLPIRYLEGKARKKMFTKYPPKTLYVSSGRIKCAMNGDFDAMKGSAISYAWYVWEKGITSQTILKWFN